METKNGGCLVIRGKPGNPFIQQFPVNSMTSSKGSFFSVRYPLSVTFKGTDYKKGTYPAQRNK